MKKILSSVLLLLGTSAMGQTLEERVEELEFARDLNVLQFSGELKNRYDNVNVKGPNGLDYSYMLWRIKFSLNLDAKVSDKLSFHGRLTQGKVMNNITQPWLDTTQAYNEIGNVHAHYGNQLYVEKAFFNYRVLESLSLSLGRLPTVEGGPYHLTIGKPMRSPYPRLAYAYSLDGAALSWTIMSGLSMKVLYHPFPTTSRSGMFYDKVNLAETDKVLSPEEGALWVAMFDYSRSNSFLAKNLNVTLHFSHAEKLYIATSSSTSETLGTLNTDTYIESKRMSAYVEMGGFLNTPLTLALAYSYGRSPASGGVFTNTVVAASGTLIESRPKVKEQVASLLTVKYDLPIGSSVGVQYMGSNKYYKFTDLSGSEPFSPWDVAGGNAGHLFYNQPLEDGLVWNSGYLFRNHDDEDRASSTNANKEKKYSSIYTEVVMSF